MMTDVNSDKKMLVILGNQLFAPEYLPDAMTTPVFMALAGR